MEFGKEDEVKMEILKVSLRCADQGWCLFTLGNITVQADEDVVVEAPPGDGDGAETG